MERLRPVVSITLDHRHSDRTRTASNSVVDGPLREVTSTPHASTSRPRRPLNLWILVCAIAILMLVFILLELHLRHAEHPPLLHGQLLVINYLQHSVRQHYGVNAAKICFKSQKPVP